MIGLQQHITFKEDTHQYFDPKGNEFQSVSRVLRLVTPEFDREGISHAMALTRSRENGISYEEARQEILFEWDKKKDSSIVRGNWIHENIESYLTIGSCDKEIQPAAKQIASFVRPFYKYFPEAILYDSACRVAGQSDLVVQRQKDQQGVFDFYDYKTNESRGIYYDSIKRDKSGAIKKHYNQFLLPPVSHLEYSNYNTYSLQLSAYALLAENTFNIKVGRLAIIFIGEGMKVKLLPVPYMKLEVQEIIKAYRS
jgi:hypothetical protein